MVKLTGKEREQAEVEAHRDAEKEAPISKKEEKKVVPGALKETATLHDLDVILRPLVTEKAVNMIESENKITFIVSKNANKREIKEVLQKAYGVKVDKVNVLKDMKGRKKAIVRLDKKSKASELATKLGVL